MQVPSPWGRDMYEVSQLFFQLLNQKDMLKRYMQVVENNPKLKEQVRQGNPFFEHGPRMWYAYYSCLLLRNLGDDDTRTTSFYNILSRIAQSECLPCIRFSDNVRLTASEVYCDRRRVREIIAPIKKFADQVIAHKQRNWSKMETPRYKDVEDCMRWLEPILIKYTKLLNGPGVARRPPLPAGWDSIFTFAWDSRPTVCHRQDRPPFGSPHRP